MNKIRTTVFLREDQAYNLRLLAELRDVSPSWIIRDLLDRYEQEIFEALEKLENE